MNDKPTPANCQPAVTTFRGDSLENSHIAHIAVVDSDGRVLMGFNDAYRMTLARSAAKPAQALAVLETGAFERFNFDDADLALMCASHSSEDRHIERTLSMLTKVGCCESDLHCGGHLPISATVHRNWIQRGFSPTAICSNCSGKHVGMLGGAQALGEGRQDYHLPGHPMQALVRRVVADVVGLDSHEVAWAIDGCNLPTPAFSLDRLALLYACLGEAADCVGGQDLSVSRRTKHLARIFLAMTRYPELVAGEGRFCTVLMNSFSGTVVGKLGADACYGIGIRASETTRRLGAKGAVGIAVKVEDGNLDILYMLVSEIFDRLEIGTAKQRADMALFHRPKIVNTRGLEVGHSTFPFVLRNFAPT